MKLFYGLAVGSSNLAPDVSLAVFTLIVLVVGAITALPFSKRSLVWGAVAALVTTTSAIISIAVETQVKFPKVAAQLTPWDYSIPVMQWLVVAGLAAWVALATPDKLDLKLQKKRPATEIKSRRIDL